MHKASLKHASGSLINDIEEAVEQVGWPELPAADSTVYIKPNLTWPFHKPGVTVSPHFLETVLAFACDRYPRVCVCESDKSDRAYKTNDTFSGHNVYEMCDRLGAEPINLTEMPWRYVEEKVGDRKIRLPLPIDRRFRIIRTNHVCACPPHYG